MFANFINNLIINCAYLWFYFCMFFFDFMYEHILLYLNPKYFPMMEATAKAAFIYNIPIFTLCTIITIAFFTYKFVVYGPIWTWEFYDEDIIEARRIKMELAWAQRRASNKSPEFQAECDILEAKEDAEERRSVLELHDFWYISVGRYYSFWLLGFLKGSYYFTTDNLVFLELVFFLFPLFFSLCYRSIIWQHVGIVVLPFVVIPYFFWVIYSCLTIVSY